MDGELSSIETAIWFGSAGGIQVRKQTSTVTGGPSTSPSATGRHRSELLDVDVDQLSGPVALIAADRLGVGRPIATVEATQALAAQDLADRRRRQPDVVRDVIGTPPPLAAQP